MLCAIGVARTHPIAAGPRVNVGRCDRCDDPARTLRSENFSTREDEIGRLRNR
jgi:hypothetical protein